ncbi:hypothetical protein [Paracoccus amoyensis]|nr:hypothetical protein [Paracoccus amoyensis]
MPDALIDLFTDQPVNDPVFSRIHVLDHGFFRPKMEAIRRTRFDKTIILDADILVTADLSEVFAILDKYEMAGVQALIRTKGMMHVRGRMPPRCFPVINTGFLAVRKSDRITAFTEAWESRVRETGTPVDQPYFRSSLYESDLSFLSLPVEYNLIQLSALDNWNEKSGAPRVLHSRRLHGAANPGDPLQPYGLEEVLGSKRAAKFRTLIAKDWSLDQKTRDFWQTGR